MRQREILLIIGSFFFLVLFYLILSIYHNNVTSTIPEELDIQITPISPNLDSKTISDLKKRTAVSPVYQAPTQTQIQQIQTQPTTQQATKSASPSAKTL